MLQEAELSRRVVPIASFFFWCVLYAGVCVISLQQSWHLHDAVFEQSPACAEFPEKREECFLGRSLNYKCTLLGGKSQEMIAIAQAEQK